MSLAIGIVLATVSAGLLNTSFFLQHRASNTLRTIHLRRPVLAMRTLCSDPVWLLGYGGGWIGWAMYIAALHFAPLSLVQATAAGGLGLLALLARFSGQRLDQHERVAALCAVIGLVAVWSSLAVPPTTGHAHLGVVLATVGAGLFGAFALAIPAQRLLHPGAGLAVAAGLCFAVGDIATKGAVSGLELVLVPVLLICNVFGFTLLQLAIQRGTVFATVGMSSLVSGVVPIVAGIIVFRESLPDSPAGWARGAGFALCVAGGVVLSGIGRPRIDPDSEQLVHPPGSHLDRPTTSGSSGPGRRS